MVLKDKVFKEALQGIRKVRGPESKTRFERLARVVPDELRETVAEWGEHGVNDREAYSQAIGKKWKNVDVMGQYVNIAHQVQDKSILKRPESLFIGVAAAGIPEYSRWNVSGVCLRDLAEQCGGSWKPARGRLGGYYCKITPEMWYRPSQEKKFLNRHYSDMRVEFLKQQIMKTQPRSMLYVPTVAIEELPSAIFEFMYRHNFHPNQITMLAPDRHFPLGTTKFLPVGMDEVFARGLPLHGCGVDHLPRPAAVSAKMWRETKRKLGNGVKILRLGVSDHLPDDPMIMFSEKERVFMREYTFPLVHHALYRTATGYGEGAIGEAVQRDIDTARSTMEETEAEHFTNHVRLQEEQWAEREAAAEEAQRARQEAAQDAAAHATRVKGSAVGRFMSRRKAGQA